MLGAQLKRGFSAVRSILRTLDRHRSMGIAAEMSFWLFCALIPLSVIALIILVRLPGAGETPTLLQTIFANAPDVTRALVNHEIAGLTQGSLQPGLVHLAIFAWLASSGLHAIYDGFEAQLGIATPWWRKRLRAILGCALLSIGVALLALLGAGFAEISKFAPLLPGPKVGFYLRSAAALVVLYGLVAGLYRLGVPTAARPLVSLRPATVVVVLCIAAMGFAYRTYLATFGDGSAYLAGLSAVVITLTTLFLFSLVMLIGLAISQQWTRGNRPPSVEAQE